MPMPFMPFMPHRRPYTMFAPPCPCTPPGPPPEPHTPRPRTAPWGAVSVADALRGISSHLAELDETLAGMPKVIAVNGAPLEPVEGVVTLSLVDSAVLDGGYLRFKAGDAVLFSVDASPFIKDGMVDAVGVADGNLVITFNTDSGKQPVSIPLTDIFDADDYYNKAAVDSLLSGKRDRTDLSVDQGKWLLVKPDGTLAWLVKPDPQQDTWTGGGFTLVYVELEWQFYSSNLSVDSSIALPPDANRLEFLGADDTSVYRLVRGSRLALDTEIPPAQVNADWNATSGVARILNKPTIPTVPTPVAPSTDPSATGKPADAKATGDALAGKLASETEHYMVGEIFEYGGTGGGMGIAAKHNGTFEDYLFTNGLPASPNDVMRRKDLPSNLPAAQGGTATSLVTTGDKYNWNAKADAADLRYRIAAANAGKPLVQTQILADRTVNLITATTETSIDIELPAPQTGRSRDFYLAVTCGSTAPTLNAPSGVTLVNAKGEQPDLSLTPSATTILRFTEVKDAGQSTSAVFCVTGGANGGGPLDLSILANEFSEQATYEEGDIVQYRGELYLCEFGIDTPGPWDGAADWTNASPVIPVLLSMIRGKADSSALDDKADSTALAPDWDSGKAYLLGEHVSYTGKMYECILSMSAASQTNPGSDTTHWKLTDLAAPDATLDIMSDGRLRVVAADGQVLWTQGYALASGSAVTLSCEKINKYVFAATTATAFSDSSTYAVGDRVSYGGKVYKCSTAVETAGAWTGATNWDEDPDTQAFALPGVPSGVVGDFVLDVDNTANEVPVMVAISGTLGTDYDLIVEKGRSSVDVLTIEGGALAELYFTMTAFGTAAKPAWRVVRLNVERQGVGS